jgi:hypothetical protein
MIYIWIVCILSLLYIFENDVSEIPEVVISIYIYKLEW